MSGWRRRTSSSSEREDDQSCLAMSVTASAYRACTASGDRRRKARSSSAAPSRSPIAMRACALAVRLEEPRGALTAPDAHRDHAVARLAAQQLVGDGADHARAGHAERVTDRDRAAVDVELGRIEAETIAAVDDLRGERLVQLPHVDVVDLQTVAHEELGQDRKSVV